MAHSRKASVLALTAILAIGVASALVAQEVPLRNWPAPSTYLAPHPSGMKSLLTDAGNPSPFIPINPCRIADTRGNGFTGQAGTPALTAGVSRNFQIGGVVPGVPAQCGIPANAQAVSFNFAVTDITANGNLGIVPQGAPPAAVSSLNYQVGFAALSNAAVIPLGASSGISILVNGSGTVDVIIDVNGYYGPSYATAHTFTLNSGANITASFHTTVGGEAVDAYCDTPSSNCWSYWTSTGTGNFAAVLSGGRGAAITASDDTYPAVRGTWTGTTGANAGIIGTTGSGNSCASGVRGISVSQPPCTFLNDAGVMGASSGEWGVLGYSPNRGVQGSRVTSASDGTIQTSGVLGYSGTIGVFSFNDFGGVGAKYFIEPHPMDSTKQINFVAVEANESLTMFRGRGRFQNGVATLRVPDDFRFVTAPDSLSIQITPIGDTANVAVTHIGLDGISVKSNRNVEFFYLVHGTRNGYENYEAIQENVVFAPDDANQRMPNYPIHVQKRLVDLGIYNPDGSVNMKTAESNGWAEKWRAAERARRAQAEAQKALLHKDDHQTHE